MALKDNLVALWEFNSDGDDSHSTNDLTNASSVGYVSGKYSQNAARFASASGDYFSIADNAALSFGDEDFSISMWVRITADNGNCRYLGKYNYDTDNREYAVGWKASGTPQFCFQIGTSSGSSVSTFEATTFGSPAVDGSEWCWLYMYHDQGNEVGISVNNGTLDITSHVGGVHSGSSDLVIGRRHTDLYCDADIQQVAIWRKILTSDERIAIYNGGAGLPYSSWDAATGQPASRRMGGVKFAGNQSLGINRW